MVFTALMLLVWQREGNLAGRSAAFDNWQKFTFGEWPKLALAYPNASATLGIHCLGHDCGNEMQPYCGRQFRCMIIVAALLLT